MSIYEEVEIEDMTFDETELMYTYPCPCGDKFRITLEELWDGEDIAKCPSCTLHIMVIYEEEDLPELPEEYTEEDEEEEDLADKLHAVKLEA
jgi:diphthamide biosynthesis protein 3